MEGQREHDIKNYVVVTEDVRSWFIHLFESRFYLSAELSGPLDSADTNGRETSTNYFEIIVGKVVLTLLSVLSVHHHYGTEGNKVISRSL